MLSGKYINVKSITINNDGFWPDLDLADFQSERSLAPNYDQTLLRDAVVSAIVEINITLNDFKQTQLSKGIKSASNIGVVKVEGLSSTVIIYKKAVFARAKADLVGEFTSVANRTDKLTDNQQITKSQLLAESSREIRKILGLKRCGVYLL